MSRRRSLIFGLLAIFAVSATVFAASWNLEKDKAGIKVYTRPTAGSSLKEFKGITVFNADYKTVNNIVDNVPGLKRWMPDTAVSKLIAVTSKDADGIAKKLYLYNITETPGPVSYRYGIIYSEVINDPAKKQIIRTMKAIPKSQLPADIKAKVAAFEKTLPVKGKKKTAVDKMIEMEMEGEWIFKDLGNGKTSVSYRVKSNPKGTLPGWVSNMGAKDLPFKALAGLKKELKK